MLFVKLIELVTHIGPDWNMGGWYTASERPAPYRCVKYLLIYVLSESGNPLVRMESEIYVQKLRAQPFNESHHKGSLGL